MEQILLIVYKYWPITSYLTNADIQIMLCAKINKKNRGLRFFSYFCIYIPK